MFIRGLVVLGLVLSAHSAVAQTPSRLAAEVERYRQACDRGNMSGCSNLGGMYREGRGVAHDDTLAVRFFRRACDGGNTMGCYFLGEMYVNGRGVARDSVRAAQVFQQACDGGLASGCVESRRISPPPKPQ